MDEQDILVLAAKVLARVQNRTVRVRLLKPFHHLFPLLQVLGTYVASSPCLTPDTDISDTFVLKLPHTNWTHRQRVRSQF